MGLLSTLLSADISGSLLALESFADDSVWATLVPVFILIGALLLGNLLRRVIPFMRKSLIPSALIGGVIILLLKFIPKVNDFLNEQNDLMEMITYHCLGLGFIAQALKKSNLKRKGAIKGIVETGVLTGGVYSLQAILGIAITIILTATGVFSFAAGGILLCLGYGQGTGQALNYGKIFEMDYGFQDGTSFGLSIAAIGFLVAAVVGVIYLNILKRRKKIRVLTEEEKSEDHKLRDFIGENEMPNTDSVDKMTISIALVLAIYAVVYGIMYLVGVNLIWGFNFLLGSLLALLTRLFLNLLSKKKVIKQEPTNNYLLDRIGGFMFDMMIIAGVAAINLDDFSSMWWQLLIICAVGAVATFFYIRLVAGNIYKGYVYEGFISMFGMMTGTASSGMILLREIDPKLETPAATNLVYSSLPAIAFGGGLLLLLNYCPKGMTESLITLGILFVAFAVFNLVLFRNKIFKRRRKQVVTAASGEGAESTEAVQEGTAQEEAAVADSSDPPPDEPPAE